jgi:ribosomal protein L25 (general stress protein Ctc)
LDAFYEYCNSWKLKVNADKTKVMVFGDGRLPQNLSFSYRKEMKALRRLAEKDIITKDVTVKIQQVAVRGNYENPS